MSATTGPMRNPRQVHDALRIAERVRLGRARYRRELRAMPDLTAARERVAELVADPPEELRGMTLFDLLVCCPRQGRQLTVRFLRKVEVGELRKVGELTERQRSLIAAVLRESNGERRGETAGAVA